MASLRKVKQRTLTGIVIFQLLSCCVLAGESTYMQCAEEKLFFFDSLEIYSQFNQLDYLEAQYNAGILQATNAPLLKDHEDELFLFSPPEESDPGRDKRRRMLFGIPPYFCGLGGCVCGLGYVYFLTFDRDATLQANWGCLTNGALYVLLVLWYIKTSKP